MVDFIELTYSIGRALLGTCAFACVLVSNAIAEAPTTNSNHPMQRDYHTSVSSSVSIVTRDWRRTRSTTDYSRNAASSNQPRSNPEDWN